MVERKVVLKVKIACRCCSEKLLKQIMDVKGVVKVEVSSDGFPHFTVTGEFELADLYKVTENWGNCVVVVSVDEIKPPPPPPPPPVVCCPPISAAPTVVIYVKNLILCPHGKPGGHGCGDWDGDWKSIFKGITASSGIKMICPP